MTYAHLLAASTILLPAIAAAQTPAPEIGTSETSVTFSTSTTLVPVKVVVRDRQGRTVGNLQGSDFLILDRGKEQAVSRYALEKTEAQQVAVDAERVDEEGKPVLQPRSNRTIAIPERFIAYIFDDVHTEVADLMRSREAAVMQLQEVMDPTTRVAVYTTSGQLNLDFTDDYEEVARFMRTIRRYTADQPDTDCPPLTYWWANQFLNGGDDQAVRALIENVLLCMPGIDSTTAAGMARSMSIAKIAQGQRESRMGLGIVVDVVNRMSPMPGTRSVIYVSSGFMLDPQLRNDQQHVLEAAIKAKVIVNTLDARGLYTTVMPMTQGAPTPSLGLFYQRLQRETALTSNNVLGEFANATGGTFVWNSNAYDEGFRRVAATPEFTHVLAFSPSNLKYDGSFHELKIRLKERPGLNPKDYEIFARSGYYAPSAAADAEEAIREEIRDAVFAREELVDVPVELSLQYFKSAPLEAHLTVIAKVNLDGVQFRKTEGRNNDVLTVISVVFDRNGNFVKGVQRVLDMKLRDETLDKLLDQGGISVRSNLDLPPGSYLVRLVVRDAEGKAMAMRNGAVEIPF